MPQRAPRPLHTPPTTHPTLSHCIHPDPDPNPHQVAPPPTMSRGESRSSSADGVPTLGRCATYIYIWCTYLPTSPRSCTPPSTHTPDTTRPAQLTPSRLLPPPPHAPRSTITTTEMRNTTWSVFSRPPMNSSLTTSDPVMEPALPLTTPALPSLARHSLTLPSLAVLSLALPSPPPAPHSLATRKPPLHRGRS